MVPTENDLKNMRKKQNLKQKKEEWKINQKDATFFVFNQFVAFSLNSDAFNNVFNFDQLNQFCWMNSWHVGRLINNMQSGGNRA